MRLLNLAVVAAEPVIVRSISVVLNRSADREQFDVHYFTSGLEALDWIQSSDCDLVITALDMPGIITGQELTRAAKHCNAHAQVIVFAAQPTAEQLHELAELGASDFLREPLDKLELRELVEQNVARLRRWDSALRMTRTHSKQQEFALV